MSRHLKQARVDKYLEVHTTFAEQRVARETMEEVLKRLKRQDLEVKAETPCVVVLQRQRKYRCEYFGVVTNGKNVSD